MDILNELIAVGGVLDQDAVPTEDLTASFSKLTEIGDSLRSSSSEDQDFKEVELFTRFTSDVVKQMLFTDLNDIDDVYGLAHRAFEVAFNTASKVAIHNMLSVSSILVADDAPENVKAQVEQFTEKLTGSETYSNARLLYMDTPEASRKLLTDLLRGADGVEEARFAVDLALRGELHPDAIFRALAERFGDSYSEIQRSLLKFHIRAHGQAGFLEVASLEEASTVIRELRESDDIASDTSMWVEAHGPTRAVIVIPNDDGGFMDRVLTTFFKDGSREYLAAIEIGDLPAPGLFGRQLSEGRLVR